MKTSPWIYALGIPAIFLGSLTLFFASYGALTFIAEGREFDLTPTNSSEVASWFQAFGSVAAFFTAIWAATLPIRESRLQAKRKGALAARSKREVITDTVESAETQLNRLRKCAEEVRKSKAKLPAAQANTALLEAEHARAKEDLYSLPWKLSDTPQEAERHAELRTALEDVTAKLGTATRAETAHTSNIDENQSIYLNTTIDVETLIDTLRTIDLNELQGYDGKMGISLALAIQDMEDTVRELSQGVFEGKAIELMESAVSHINRYKRGLDDAERYLVAEANGPNN